MTDLLEPGAELQKVATGSIFTVAAPWSIGMVSTPDCACLVPGFSTVSMVAASVW